MIHPAPVSGEDEGTPVGMVGVFPSSHTSASEESKSEAAQSSQNCDRNVVQTKQVVDNAFERRHYADLSRPAYDACRLVWLAARARSAGSSGMSKTTKRCFGPQHDVGTAT